MPVRPFKYRPGYIFVVPILGEKLQGKWAHAVRDDDVGRAVPALCENKPTAGALWVRRAPLRAHKCPACHSLMNQLIGSAGGRHKGPQVKEEPRPIRELGRDIRALWRPTRRENLERALRVLESVDRLEDTCEGMTGLQAVEYFLQHSWRCWRGKQTYQAKRELQVLMRLGQKRAKHGDRGVPERERAT